MLKFAIRNITKRPFLNLIKVTGLSLVLGCLLLIVLFLKNELTYDKYHENADRIYRFTITNPDFLGEKHFARVHNPEYIPEMANQFPEIENYVRLIPIRGGAIKHREKYISTNQAFQCDSTFFKVFDSILLVGNSEIILDDPGTMVVSESFAKRVFGNANPVGEVMTLPAGQYYGENVDFTIQGIMKDFPQNSHFHPECIVTPKDKRAFNNWAWTYLLLSDNANPNHITAGFQDFYASYVDKNTSEIKTNAHLQNITDIHLHSDKLREIEPTTNMSIIYTLSLAILILLFIALFNYANLNIGMAHFIDKYLFISKISGSSKQLNLKYLLTEGIIIITATVLISALIVTLAHFVLQKHFSLNLFTGNIPIILLVTVIFVMLVILTGILPLFNPLKIKFRATAEPKDTMIIPKRKSISKCLVILQFTISTALIVAVIVILRQTNYVLKNSMGVEANNLICFENVHSNVQDKFEVFKAELLNYHSIASVSAMFEPPGGEANDMFKFSMEEYKKDETDNDDERIGVFPCDYSFASIFSLNFLSGRNFSENAKDNEGSGEYIINESAMKKLNYSNPDEIIGKAFKLNFEGSGIHIPSGKIIGVVEDFHLSSMKKAVEPLVMFKRKNLWLMNFVVAFHPGMKNQAIADIESVWETMFPEYPFQYAYVDSMYEDVYKTELLQARLLSLFTLIALFICSMGLLGLSFLTTQRRTQEIGLRKVNGAKTIEIISLLNQHFVKWMIISFVLAIPLAYFAMNKWLENFAYRIDISWWIFALAGISALIIAVITVSVQSWKAASRNPVEALRYE